jgi:hypothetical protein
LPTLEFFPATDNYREIVRHVLLQRSTMVRVHCMPGLDQFYGAKEGTPRIFANTKESAHTKECGNPRPQDLRHNFRVAKEATSAG